MCCARCALGGGWWYRLGRGQSIEDQGVYTYRKELRNLLETKTLSARAFKMFSLNSSCVFANGQPKLLSYLPSCSRDTTP